MRMLTNIGGGGHLKQPCYNCLIGRQMTTNRDFGVKQSTNHLEFYDYTFCQSIPSRSNSSYSSNPFGSLPVPLQEIIGDNDFESFFMPGTLHTLLGLNSLFDHVSQHNRWIPDMFNRLRSEKLTESEMFLIHQQKLIKIIFNSLVPIRTQDGLEKVWTGGQLKKVLSISRRILDVILTDFPSYTYLINFLKLLVAFNDMYQAMFGKHLQNDWDTYAFLFLEKFKLFLDGSMNIGYIQFHSIVHTVNICAKHNLGAGSLGLDQSIEALHSHVHYTLLPNIKKTRKPASDETFTDDNRPSDGYINKFTDIHGVQLETALAPLKLKRVVLENVDYLKTLDIDTETIKEFDDQAHNHGLLIKLTHNQSKKIQTQLKT